MIFISYIIYVENTYKFLDKLSNWQQEFQFYL